MFMSIFNLSLCPGGAFMMHEDASEYDQNVAPKEVSAETRAAAVANSMSRDPVIDLITATKPYYEMIKVLEEINLEPIDNVEAVRDLGVISATASDIAEMLRRNLIRRRAESEYMNTNNVGWLYDSFLTNAGVLLRNKDYIVNAGYGKYTLTSRQLSDAIMLWPISRMIMSYLSINTRMPEYPLNIRSLDTYAGKEEPVLRRFSSLSDFFNCIYYDIERLYRLENEQRRTGDLLELFDNVAWRSNRPTAVADGALGDPVIYPTFISWISERLRDIKQTSYAMQCDVLDDDVLLKREQYHKSTRAMISTVYDMFTLGMLFLITSAYEIRAMIDYRQCIDTYIAGILEKIRNKGKYN